MKFEDNFKKYNFPKLGLIKIPKFGIPNEFKSSDEYLIHLAEDGLAQKIKNGTISCSQEDQVKYWDRLNFEIGEINKLLFTDYILLVYKIIEYCRKNDILNSPSRGSAGGSLLLYVLGCVGIDPIKHELLFERFISSARTEVKKIDGDLYIDSGSVPDVDIDSNASKKSMVNNFIEDLFPKRTAPIINVVTYQTKAVLKDVCKIVGMYSEDQADHVSKMIETQFGKVQTIDDALETNEQFQKWAADNFHLVNIARQIHGLIKNKSIHAAGILLTNEELMDTVPTELSSDKRLVTGYSMEDAQKLGIKVDNLGLKNLDVIQETLGLIGKSLEDIDVNDSSIYEFLNASDHFYGIFQAESGLGKNVLKKIHPESIDDIMASVALGRPGSMQYVDEYCRRKESGDVPEVDPRVAHILNPTYNILLYQEQAMQLTQVMADFEPRETNDFRKAIGKKIKEKMLSYKERFIEAALKNGYEYEFVHSTWDTFEASADYSFNKSHATGYGYLTAITAYLKTNHPREFFLNLLRVAHAEQKPLDEISLIQSELRHFGLKLLPPHLLKSKSDFSVEGNNIRYGLEHIKGISNKSLEKLNKFRVDHPNKIEIFQAANECEIPLNILSSLILAGSLDDMLEVSRAKCFMEACLWSKLTQRERALCFKYGEQFNYDVVETVRQLHSNLGDDKGKLYIKDSRYETIKKNFNDFVDIYNHNIKNGNFSKWYFERVLIGFSFSIDLYSIFKQKVPNIRRLGELTSEWPNTKVGVVGLVTEVKNWTARSSGRPCFKMTLQDNSGAFDFLFTDNDSFQSKTKMERDNGRFPEKDDVVIIEGSTGKDIVFGNKCKIFDFTVLRRVSDLKKEEKKERGQTRRRRRAPQAQAA